MKGTLDLFGESSQNYRKQGKRFQESYAAMLRKLGQPVISDEQDEWLGLGLGKERIIGTNELIKVAFLSEGLRVAKTVCRIITLNGKNKRPIGTGFLVGPGLLMTNNHVLGIADDAQYYKAEFEYEENIKGETGDTFIFSLDPERFFVTNSKLDYTVVGISATALNAPGKELLSYGWNILGLPSEELRTGTPLSIIQHPLGNPKMIAIRDNLAVRLTSDFVQYNTDTQQGSSGSLVANDKWEIVALHSSGVPATDPNGNYLLMDGSILTSSEDQHKVRYICNQGTLISSILADIDNKAVPKNQLAIKETLLESYHRKIDGEGYQLPG